MSGNALKIIIIAIIAVAAVGSAVMFIVPSEHDDNGSYSIDYGYLYEGFYLDLNTDDHILVSYAGLNSNNRENSLQSVTADGNFRTVRMYSDEGRTNEIAYKLPINNIIRSEGFHIVSFRGLGSGSLSEMEQFGDAYAELHPEKTGIQPIPSYWGVTQYYWLDDETGRLHYLPITSDFYDFDKGSLLSTGCVDLKELIGCSSGYLYYSASCSASISDQKEYDGVFRVRVDGGALETQKLFDRDIFRFKAVMKNDILLASDIILFPDGGRAEIPDGYDIIDGLLCKNVVYADVDNWREVNRISSYSSSLPLIKGYPVSADCLSDDGTYVHKEYTESESKRVVEKSAYRYHTELAWKDRFYFEPVEYSLFDIVNHRYYAGTEIVDFTTLIPNGSSLSVSREKVDLENVHANTNVYNFYLVSDGTSLYLYDIFSEKRTLLCGDLYKVTSLSNPMYGYIEVSYSDNQYVNHVLYVLPDGTISQERNVDLLYIFI